MNEMMPKKVLFAGSVSSLVEEAKDKDKKPKATDVITFIPEIESRQSLYRTNLQTWGYKVLRRDWFAEWIDFQKAILELWRQNGTTSTADRVANIRTILQGDSLTDFEEKLQELITSTSKDRETEVLQIIDESVSESKCCRSYGISFQIIGNPKTVDPTSHTKAKGTFSRLNNSLPLFPNGKELDKFIPGEVLEILKQNSLRNGSWQSVKQSNKMSQKCTLRAIIQLRMEKPWLIRKMMGLNIVMQHLRNDTTTKFYCTKHRQNPTHPTDKCYTLKNCADKAKGTSSLAFTKKSSRKEINILAKGRPRKKILEMFAIVLQQEHKKLAAKTSKEPKKNKIILDESSNSSDQNIWNISTKFWATRNASWLKINASKSFFARSQLEYLGYWIPLNEKVEAINNLAPPKNCSEGRKFIGFVNYYCDRWKTFRDPGSFNKADVHQKSMEMVLPTAKCVYIMKKIMAGETILAYPNSEIPLEIHKDASAYQLGACISQNEKRIALYSRKLTPAQTGYTTTERELLSIVKALKEFWTILLGQQLIVHTDHESLTYKHFNSDWVMQWSRLFIEEFSPDLHYIKGTKNVAANALSCFGILNNPMDEEHFTEALCSELYAFHDEDLP
jgi:hypothetical protein